jgi:hypothetical protein
MHTNTMIPKKMTNLLQEILCSGKKEKKPGIIVDGKQLVYVFNDYSFIP